ncbi:MAG: GtrA family protein [Nitrospirae bacterium]|uniref:GtrA family protein n=1 Tax=Candidatus Magnetobacterium casense TaxID=1455061 RepID=UPI00058E2711|nr:GtrA family protein [Candidatus Magnetobacterium casensis]MBF0338056.1 GtrA family protein [Nitrospirota bacterium]
MLTALRRLPLKQFLRFALIGVLNTLVDLVVLNIETLITGARQGTLFAMQKAVSVMVAVFFSYHFNKRWTFEDRSTGKDRKKLLQFIVVSAAGMGLNVTVATIVATVGVGYTGIHPQVMVNIGALCGTAAGLLWNFAGYKLWVFKQKDV